MPVDVAAGTPRGSTRCDRATPAGGHPVRPRSADPDQDLGPVAAADHGLPFSTWSLAKLADFLATEWSTTSAMRVCVACFASRVSPFQPVKTFKVSTDPDYETKKHRVVELHARSPGQDRPLGT